jgi:hypothetical protein
MKRIAADFKRLSIQQATAFLKRSQSNSTGLAFQ